MSKPIRAVSPTCSTGLHWQVTDDGSRTLWDESLNETYHSGSGAVVESLVVYLKNSGVYDRLRQGAATAVLEYGLGTGTAFLLTAATAIAHGAPLRYRALELSLLPAAIFAELRIATSLLDSYLVTEFDGVLEVAQRLVCGLAAWRAALPTELAPGVYGYSVAEHIELEVIVGDAAEYCSCGDRFDAVYFDPFSPSTCPTLWTPHVFQAGFDALRAGGTLTSYCVKSAVRQELLQVGFQVERLKGPIGGKREVLRAIRPLD